jgi:flagellar basal body P-ring formation protein FlgA
MIKILLFLVWPVISYAGFEPELTFSSATEVSPRNEITVYDIVEAKNLNDLLVNELKTIKIADSKSTHVEKTDLAKNLRHIKARFVLPSEIKIVRSKNEVSRMEVERKIKNHLQINCFECELKIQISSVPSNLASDWNLDLNIDLTKNTAMIPIYSTSQPDKKGWVVAQIKRYQNIPVLNRSAKMGEVITKDMLSFEKRQVFNVRETILNKEAIEGMQTSRYINAGQPLMYIDLKREVVMKRGQIVRVLVGNDSFEVSMSGQVEESGSIGEVIKIKNLDSQKVFAAKIIDRGVVRIE